MSALRIGIVVGEVSGDNLAFNLIQSLRVFYPNLSFEGILGPKLIQAGGKALYPMERLSVMGLPFRRFPEILRIRRAITQHFIQNPPDIFIGVDSPDFNLTVELKLKAARIPVVHYGSPTIWAWRSGRIKKIKNAVDLMLTLFPFEAPFYQDAGIPVCFTGHPLADQIPLEIATETAKKTLRFDLKKPVIALLPGSRNSELKNLAEIYLLTARFCYHKRPNLQFVVPLVSKEHQAYFEALHQKIAPELPLKIVVGNSALAIAASDVVLVTSGTATLEVMLHKKPMVVAYRMHPFSFFLAKLLIKVRFISQPNLIANEAVVPEFIQEMADPQRLGPALLEFLSPSFNSQKLKARFLEMHQLLRRGASEIAAKAIDKLLVSKLKAGVDGITP